MNLILLEPREISGACVALTGRRAEHIARILRAVPGDLVRVGIVNGPLGQGRVLSLNGKQVLLEVGFDTEPPYCPPTDLILALPRPIMLKRVLAQAVSLGVRRIFLINARRVEKSFFASSLMKDNDFNETLRLGLEQAIDTRLPEVSVHPRFRPFIEDLLPGLLAGCPIRLFAHPQGDGGMARAAGNPGGQRVALAIGPEGGWVDFELELFRAQGFIPFTLGPRILRVDTAVPALLAQLDLLRQNSSDLSPPDSLRQHG